MSKPKHFIGGKIVHAVAKDSPTFQQGVEELLRDYEKKVQGGIPGMVGGPPGPPGPRGETGPEPSTEKLKALIREVIREMRKDVANQSPKADLTTEDLFKLI